MPLPVEVLQERGALAMEYSELICIASYASSPDVARRAAQALGWNYPLALSCRALAVYLRDYIGDSDAAYTQTLPLEMRPDRLRSCNVEELVRAQYWLGDCFHFAHTSEAQCPVCPAVAAAVETTIVPVAPSNSSAKPTSESASQSRDEIIGEILWEVFVGLGKFLLFATIGITIIATCGIGLIVLLILSESGGSSSTPSPPTQPPPPKPDPETERRRKAAERERISLRAQAAASRAEADFLEAKASNVEVCDKCHTIAPKRCKQCKKCISRCNEPGWNQYWSGHCRQCALILDDDD